MNSIARLDVSAKTGRVVACRTRIGYSVAGPVRYAPVYRRGWTTLTIIAGFLLGLFLARIDHIVSPVEGTGSVKTIAVIVDWTAPPLAGGLVAAAFFVAQRYKRLHEAERAASRVLAERLAGTERRQAIWVVAAAIAHDLKNPLHNVQLLLEEASEEADPARRSELLARLRDNTDRAASRLSDLARAGRPTRSSAWSTSPSSWTICSRASRPRRGRAAPRWSSTAPAACSCARIPSRSRARWRTSPPTRSTPSARCAADA